MLNQVGVILFIFIVISHTLDPFPMDRTGKLESAQTTQISSVFHVFCSQGYILINRKIYPLLEVTVLTLPFLSNQFPVLIFQTMCKIYGPFNLIMIRHGFI